ncbi:MULTISPECIES: CPBP family intramembrane glutamic endopeptidase [Bhargavaea]|uniref:CPBP family intramembrane glutamic endopeptidase n=1 Tax=Bhargavaea changchunensis TaxID=2134037 RepID=A0ABW2NKV0_9BACL|nr:CPBP family intramembrane glutamic endopeptidase [Bhargavaea sp. CC-171006]
MKQNRKNIVGTSIAFIFLVTFLVHAVLVNLEDGRAFLGAVMAVPLIVVLAYQAVYCKLPVRSTLGLFRPNLKSMLFSILFPVLLGITFHVYLSYHGIQFLFEQEKELGLLFVIGLTVATLSALLEEVVWRGNFHHHLRKNHPLFRTAVIIAAAWSLWHLPIAVFYKGYGDLWTGITTYIGLLFLVSMTLTYVREAGRSVIPAAILHGMLNVFYLSDGLQSGTAEQEELSKFLFYALVLGLMAMAYGKGWNNLNIIKRKSAV